MDKKEDKKEEELKQRELLFKKSVKIFHEQMGDLDKFCKVLRKDLEHEEIFIEFSDTIWDKLYIALLAADIVVTIDSFVYNNTMIVKETSHLEEIKEKLARFKK